MHKYSQKRRTMEHYDQIARVYDMQYYVEQEAKIKAALMDLTLKKEEIILDVGCGTGLLFPHLATKIKLVIGVDVSSSIVNQAKKRAKEYGNTALVISDADHLPFLNETFDAVLAITLLQNMSKPDQTLNEIKRVTKQTSRIVISGLKKTFSQKRFKQLLKKEDLTLIVFRSDENLKDYIAICAKTQRKP
jgi:ubiquinone/menaquinone biosynthesis C-methylase UbiE